MAINKFKFSESPFQRRIRLDKSALIPLEISTAWITDDEELLESCRQLYHYVVDGYDDILNNPEENFVDPLDPVFDTRPGNRDMVWDSMRFHRDFHRDFLIALFRYAFLIEIDAIVVKNEDYKKFLLKRKLKFPKEKDIKERFIIPFSFQDLMTTLSRRGIVIMQLEHETIIKNAKYPQMFLAFERLFQAVEAFHAKTRRTSQWFLNMDFRAIENPFRKPELDDLFYSLTLDEREVLDKLNSFAEQKKLKCKHRNMCGIRDTSFRFHDKHILSFYWCVRTGLKIRVTLPEPPTAEHEVLFQKIKELENAKELIDFCLSNLYECFYCSKACVKNSAYKKKWVILGRPAPKLVTTCWGFGVYFSLTEETLRIAKTLVDLLIEVYVS